MTDPEWAGLGPWLVGAGLLLVAVGLLVWTGGFGWFGRLPGDLRFDGERSRIYVPVTSMILLSVVLTLLLTLAGRLMR